jgi:replicative DNA helicase
MPSDVYNSEAEQFLIAAILRNPKSYFEINTVGLSADDFVNPKHQHIFKAINSALQEKADPTIPYVVEYLRIDNRDGIVDYVSELASVPCSVTQAHDYAKMVKGLSISRKLQDAGVKIIDLASDNRADYFTTLTEAENILRAVSDSLPVNERSPHVSDILSRLDSQQHVNRIPITFAPTLDSMTGGLSRGAFWVIGGFTSTGKSAFACNLALDVLTHKRSIVGIASAEMTQEQYLIRMLAIESGIPQLDIASRVTIGIDRQTRLEDAKKKLRDTNLYVYDNLYTMSKIRTEMQRLKNQQGLDVFILDYIQNITITGDEISDARQVAIECQQMAKDLNCTVIAFSQVSNQQAKDDLEKDESDYFSFKGHGAIRDAADVAIMLKRGNQSQSSALRVNIMKNRHGPMTRFKCRFDLATGMIEEWQDEYADD